MSEVKNKKKKSSIIQVSIGVLAVILAILIIIMMGNCLRYSGNGPYCKLYRFSQGRDTETHKTGASMQQENEMIHDIRTFIDGLRNGNDELNLVCLNDVDFSE